jgi:hypothetical protein
MNLRWRRILRGILISKSSEKKIDRLVSGNGHEDRMRQLEPEGQLPSGYQRSQRPSVAVFGLMPLAVPYDDSPPELRVLNAVAAGLLFEGRTHATTDLGLSKPEFARVLRSLKANGAIHVGAGGRYRLSFNTANFPGIVARR